MSVRFGSKGSQLHALIDHNNLLNKGVHTHAELDTIVDEVIEARGAEPSLKAYIDNTVGNLTSNFMYSRQVALDGQTVFSLVQTGVGYKPQTNTLQVYVNGQLQDLTTYAETDQFTVTFQDPLTKHDVVIFRVDGRSDGANAGNSAEQELLAAHTNANPTPTTFADLKSRLDYMDSVSAQIGLQANGAYKKPSTGIPKTDLATSVQSSLNNADAAYQKPSSGIPYSDMSSQLKSWLTAASTAYQKPSGGIPKSDLTADLQTALTTADNAYVKPSTGIPKTDLSSAVQASLNKADTAYQKPFTGIPSADLDDQTRNNLSLAFTSYQKPGTGIPLIDLSADVQNAIASANTAYQKPSTGIPLSDLADGIGSKYWKDPVPTAGDLPTVDNSDGDIRVSLDDNIIHRWDETAGDWKSASGGSGGGGTDQEVVAARTNTSPYTFPNLKARLDDIDSRIESIGVVSGGGGDGSNSPAYYMSVDTTETYQYDTNGRIIKTAVSGDINKTVTYQYDDMGDIVTETVQQDGKTLSVSYQYDPDGNLNSVNRKGVESLLVRTAIYDDTALKKRLTSLEGNANYQVSYEYDTNGNITKEVLTGDINRTSTFTYDPVSGDITTETKVENGRSTIKEYQYDTNGRLTGISVTYI